MGTSYGLYKKRAWILNRWNKKKFQKGSVTAVVGKSFSKKIIVPAKSVKSIRVLHEGDPLANEGELPEGFRYNQFNNSIESENVPDPNELTVLTVQVIGEADKILEQFTLKISEQNQVDDHKLSINANNDKE